MSKHSIHLWVPGIGDGAGGIQAFSRVYAQAIHEAYPDVKLLVFVKNDTVPQDDPLRKMGIGFVSVAHFPNCLRTIAFLLAGLGFALLSRPICAIATHLHFLPALAALRGLTKIPFIGILHGIDAWHLREGPRLWAMQSADHLVAVSHFTRNVAIDSYGLDPRKISVIPNTFDVNRFVPGPKSKKLLQRYHIRPEQPVILTVSRLAKSERYKGHRQVLAAMPTILKKHPNLHYLILGTGDDLDTLKILTSKLGLNDYVTFTGHVSSDELADHYRLCDAFVMPSSNEGFGIVFLEAMACGKPVIAGSVDGSVDALDQGRLGILVNPNDLSEISKAVCYALSESSCSEIWKNAQRLHREVVTTFGYPRISQLMGDDLSEFLKIPLSLKECKPSISKKFHINNLYDDASDFSSNLTPKKLKLVVLTQLTSPYQVEFFNTLAKRSNLALHLIYLTSRDRSRNWHLPNIDHSHIILSESPELKGRAMDLILKADLTVFNYYTDWFSLNAIRNRSANNRPWVFWGERPGFFQTGIAGTLARRILLHPLHRSLNPIWGVGRFGIEGYQREFGLDRNYFNLPYFSDLKRFYSIIRKAKRPRTFLYSGSFSYRKGCDLLVVAFARLATRYPKAQLILVGSGSMEEEMRDQLSNCSNQVIWMGFQDWDRLPEAYALGDILCLPSRYDGWGLALVEGLASGMPAIGSDRTGSALEFLEDNSAGWLVKAGDVKDLHDAMENALNTSKETFSLMQTHARRLVKDNSVEEGADRFNRAVLDAKSWFTKDINQMNSSIT